MAEIRDVAKAGKGDAKASLADTSMDSAVNPINQRIATLVNISPLARYLPDQ